MKRKYRNKKNLSAMDALVMDSMTTARWLLVFVAFSAAKLMPSSAPGDFSTSTSNGLWAYWLLSTRATSYSMMADNLNIINPENDVNFVFVSFDWENVFFFFWVSYLSVSRIHFCA